MNIRTESLPTPTLPDYAFGERLGAGSYGTVYKARLISNIPSRPASAACSRPASARPASALPPFYAIKCINRKSLTKTTEDLLINEIRLLKHIKHENIVEMYDFQWDENYIYIIMEYCAGGDMSMFIRSRQQLSEVRARPFVKQIAKVLKFLKEKNLTHMDLKPENILLLSTDKPTLKVADFGVAQHIGTQGSRSIRGTLMYMAPEILSSHPYDNRVDLWSIGVILYECLFGRPPFVFISINDLIDTIKSDVPIEIPNDVRLSPECRHLLEGLLQRDPDKRISFTDFFRHPFIFNNHSLQINRANELLKQSSDYERSGDLQKALGYHLRALDEYVAIIKIDEDADHRRTLRAKVAQGIHAAEELKKRIRETTGSSGLTPPITTSTLPSPTMIHTGIDLNNDKELLDAYQHCLNGNQLMNQFVFEKAVEEYEKGLTVMFRVSQIETDTEKKEILRKMIIHYLSKAESCKQKSETQRLDLAIEKLKLDTANDATITEHTIPDELINSEKKQQSTLPQNCRLQ